MKHYTIIILLLICSIVSNGQTFRELKRKAELGEIEAMHQLAKCYHLGDSTQQNYSLAVKWYKQAALKGFPNSLNNLALCYIMGTGVPIDTIYAIQLLHQAADQGLTTSMSGLATIFRKGGSFINPDSCFYWEQKAAEKGVSYSQFMLSIYYEKGFGVHKDAKKSFEWRLRAAECGDALAAEGVAVFYRDGFGVEKNYEQMIFWLEKAAISGQMNSLVYLGTIYQRGMYGLPIDKEKAFVLFMQAANQDDAWGAFELGECYRYGRGTKQDKNLARYWIYKAATQGLESAIEAWREIDTGIDENELRLRNEEYKQWFKTNR